jgi:hypothetical protein
MLSPCAFIQVDQSVHSRAISYFGGPEMSQVIKVKVISR